MFDAESFFATVGAGVPFDLTVSALDAAGNVIPDYTGEVFIFSTDPKGVTPLLYTFQPADRGVARFPGGVTLVTPGYQLLLAFDTATFEVFGFAIIEVV